MKYDTPYSPSDVDYAAERLDVLEKHFDKMQARSELQGYAYCLSRGGKKFALGSGGRMEFMEDSRVPMPGNAFFKVASITKLFTAVAIMKLVEDGLFRLDEPVGKMVKEFDEPPFNKITIAHLLTHTSGLQADENCFENPYFYGPYPLLFDAAKKGDNDWVKNSLRSGLRREPGTEWAYSTYGFMILGEVINRTIGYNVEDFIKKELLEPCEMYDSGFGRHFDKRILDRFCVINERHLYLREQLRNGTPRTPEDVFCDLLPGTGGGLFSTVEDLNKFGIMLMDGGYYNGKRVIGRKAIEKMTARHTGSDIKEYCWGSNGVERAYALGPDIRNNLSTVYSSSNYYHEGAGACCLMIDPTEHLVASWLVPFRNNEWYAGALYNAASIMWSGLR